jgi:predicted lysophospholipase L1 biosynthesis ABC-type transport system permease subunit
VNVIGMMRDHWWWPWWVSSLIDIGVVLVALAVFRLSSRRIVRAVAGVFVLAGLVAAVMAPIVMTEKSDHVQDGEQPMMP